MSETNKKIANKISEYMLDKKAKDIKIILTQINLDYLHIETIQSIEIILYINILSYHNNIYKEIF